MKKILVLGLCFVTAVLLMTACNIISPTEPDSNVPVSSEQGSRESETPTAEPSDSKPEDSQKPEATTAEPSESKPEESKPTETETPKEPTAASAASLGEKYVDLDNRCFAVNGKVYTLGVSTLQEMIDDGVPFSEKDLANANNNLNSNYESMGFKIELGEYYNAQVFVANYSEDNASTASCVLSEVYLAVHQDSEQKILQFAFPFSLTEEELIAQAGEPTDRRDYKSDDSDYESHTLEYTVKSEKYFGDSGYTLEFANGVLKYVTIDWKP